MAMRQVASLRNLKSILDQPGDHYPFYAVLLYTPGNGLNARLHEYIKSHWTILNGLTGENCLLMAIEDFPFGPSIERFKPEDVYKIAHEFGAEANAIPGMIFFAEPRVSGKTQVLKLNEFLSGSSNLTDEELTDFFQSIQSIIDRCSASAKTADQRLKCLHKGLNKEWPPQSRWADVAKKVKDAVIATSTLAGTIALAVDKIIPLLPHLK